uniref:ARAD1A11242p n=1 Tax=Blastobotrys adeninivorans TaxID=409370 RepID=A0A060T2U3_BLAAD
MIALVSGANSGIGYAVATKLAQEFKYHVVIGSRNESKGKQALQELQGTVSPELLSYVQLDVTDDVSISKAIDTIRQTHGRLDVLINNAGIDINSDQSTSPRQRYLDSFNTNTVGPAILTDACIPLLEKSTNPRIVFVSSSLGSLQLAANGQLPRSVPAYEASKAALSMIMLHYAARYPHFRINACNPGWVRTKLTKFSGMGDASDGANIVCKLATVDENEPTGLFVAETGSVPW